MNDLEITTLIKTLSRPHPSGGVAIERAAIIAAGADSQQVIDWIVTHSGEPETPAARSLGLHGAGINAGDNRILLKPSRFVLPAGVLH